VSVSVYVILGHQDEQLGLMIAMEEMKLFDKGEVTINPPNLFNNVIIIIIIIKYGYTWNITHNTESTAG
jgi:hypothetical protein